MQRLLSPTLVPRGRAVLQELVREDAIVGFQGLRRRLGLHPESLRRALDRLEEDGLVEDAEGGYQATEAGRQAMPELPDAEPGTVVLRMLLPDGDVTALVGKWIGDLRWYGISERPGETVLIWTTPGGLLRMRVRAGTLTIETVGDVGFPEITRLLGSL